MSRVALGVGVSTLFKSGLSPANTYLLRGGYPLYKRSTREVWVQAKGGFETMTNENFAREPS